MKLVALFIFNPTLSHDEDTADENILCYHPPDVARDHQLNEVGFCAALMRLQERFGVHVAPISTPNVQTASGGEATPASPTSSRTTPSENHKPFSSATCATAAAADAAHATLRPNDDPPFIGVSLASKRYIILPVEPNVFVAAIITRETFERAFSTGQGKISTVWKEGLSATTDEADDSAARVVHWQLRTFYAMFRMMFGSISSNYAKLCDAGCTSISGGMAKHKSQQRAAAAAAATTGQSPGSFSSPPPSKPGAATASVSAAIAANLARQAEEDCVRRRILLRHFLYIGFIQKVLPSLAVASHAHDLEGSFACPGGVDVMPLPKEVYLPLASLVGFLTTAHPSAIRSAVVAVGSRVVYSSLSVTDTATLFLLMQHYSAERSSSSSRGNNNSSFLKASSFSQTSGAGGGPGSTRASESGGGGGLWATGSGRSVGGGGGNDVAASLSPFFDDSSRGDIYAPDTLLRTESRRSQFLRDDGGAAATRSSRSLLRRPAAAAASAAGGGGGGSSSMPNFGMSSRRSIASASEYGSATFTTAAAATMGDGLDFPFIFLDDEPVGVYVAPSSIIGPTFRIMLLVNDKYLRLPPLRDAFVQSVERTLLSSHIPSMLRNVRVEIPEDANALDVDPRILFHYTSAMVRQVRSSIVTRLAPAAGSLAAPLTAAGLSASQRLVAALSGGGGGGGDNGSMAGPVAAAAAAASASGPLSGPRSPPSGAPTHMQRLLTGNLSVVSASPTAAGASGSSNNNNTANSGSNSGGGGKRLKATDRQGAHELDRVRCAILDAVPRGLVSALCHTADESWCAYQGLGVRELSAFVGRQRQLAEAEKMLDGLNRVVFFASFRPPL